MSFEDDFTIYRRAVDFLKSNHTTVPERRQALDTVSRFENDLRSGRFDNEIIQSLWIAKTIKARL